MNSIQFLQLVFTKVQFNLKSEASNSYLSYIWWLLEPALYVGTFYLVFSIFMATKTPDFIVFLCCGNIPFTWFSRTINNAGSAIIGGKGLMNQIHITKAFFPVVVIFQDLFKTIIVFMILLMFVWFNGFEPSEAWLAIPVIMLAQLLLISSIAIFVSMIVPFIPDMRFIISTGLMMLMFGSGLFYDYKQVILPEHQDIFLMNPIANLISMYRQVLMEGLMPNWLSLLYIFSISSVSLLLALLLLKKLDSTYTRLVLE